MRLVAVVAALCAAALTSSAAAKGSCIATSPAELASRAGTVFEGEALPGRTGFNGILVSPALFRVSEYLKGSGPDEVAVETGLIETGFGFRGTSVSIEPRAGERWRIFTPSGIGGIVLTTTCDGSGVLDEESRVGDRRYARSAPVAGPYDPAFPWRGALIVVVAVAIGAALGLGIVVARRRLGDQGLSP